MGGTVARVVKKTLGSGRKSDGDKKIHQTHERGDKGKKKMVKNRQAVERGEIQKKRKLLGKRLKGLCRGWPRWE